MPGPGARDEVRRRNLAAVLELVHRTGPVSRAWLTARTRLNRSTVGDLVAELVATGLLVENEPEATNRVGRPSPIAATHPDVVAIAVNPEVDAVTIATVGLGAQVQDRRRVAFDVPPTPEQTADVVAGFVRGVTGRRIAGIGLAVPGLVREADGFVRWAPHLEWRDARLGELVQSASGLPTSAANDATLGAVAEHVFGAGRDVDDLVYLHGGASGIGGGIIVGGRRLGGRGGYAGEFGHDLAPFIDPADRVSTGGQVEDEIGRQRMLSVLGLRGASDDELVAAMHAPTPAVSAELTRQRRVLAAVMAGAVNVLDPQLLVLDGYLAMLRDTDPAALEALVAAHVVPSGEPVPIVGTAAGDDRLLVGAGELAFARLLSDPVGVGGMMGT
jgi:predicted NBD/HSP70 family sugar kinase